MRFVVVHDRAVFSNLLNDLAVDPSTTILAANQDLFQNAVELFAARPDKEWSLTDCTSFIAMRELGVTDVLTADRHFAQAGYSLLLVN